MRTKRRNKKAQSALEFILLFSFIFLVFLAMFAVFNKELITVTKENEDILTTKLLTRIATEIELASTVSDKYQKTFKIPYTLHSQTFDIVIEEERILVLTFHESGIQKVRVLPVAVKDNGLNSGNNFIVQNQGVVCINIELDSCIS